MFNIQRSKIKSSKRKCILETCTTSTILVLELYNHDLINPEPYKGSNFSYDRI